MIKRFAIRLIKTFIMYQVSKRLNMGDSRKIKPSYKAVLKRIK